MHNVRDGKRIQRGTRATRKMNGCLANLPLFNCADGVAYATQKNNEIAYEAFHRCRRLTLLVDILSSRQIGMVNDEESCCVLINGVGNGRIISIFNFVNNDSVK